ncbi:RDD family protein [Solibacillus sp. FSL W7-1472]|uniref:RDD family protein n=1 Tax=Solibacillus sp. FSL W7-1472 TaxID=2921707 RepID=UPI001E50EB53|nr:RDD family protein [Solibacillus silvestris]
MNFKKPAGFGIRFVASFIDFLIISSIFGIVFYMINGNYSIEQTEEFTFQALYTLYLTITPILWGGYVIGKKICKVKIKRFNDDEKPTILKHNRFNPQEKPKSFFIDRERKFRFIYFTRLNFVQNGTYFL